MLERTVNLPIEEAFCRLKAEFDADGSKLLNEDAPAKVSFRQGSLWGVTPKTAKKTINLTLEPTESGTQVKCRSQLSSDWKNVTLVGCVFAFVLAAVCVWMAVDLGGAVSSGDSSFWSWLITVEGEINFTVGAVFVNLVWGLAGFLFAVIAIESTIVMYAQKKIDAFAAEVLRRPFRD